MKHVSPRAQQLYEKQIRNLPVDERLQLIRLVIDELSDTFDQWENEETEWMSLSLNTFQEGWDNPEDAVYDNWREASGLSTE